MVLGFVRVLAAAPLILTGLVALQPAARADVPMQLVGTNAGISMGGVYTSPYQIDVDWSKTPILLVCDDFATDIGMNYTWQATEYTLAQIGDNGPQKFTSATTPYVVYPDGTKHYYTIEEDYDAVAWLTYQLVTTPAILTDPTTSGQYSFAIWQVFDTTAIDGYDAKNELDSTDMAAVTSDLTNAFSFATGLAAGTTDAPAWLSQVEIFTPSPTTASQEFIGIGVPEATAPPLLAFDFLVLAGIAFLVRRRVRRDLPDPGHFRNPGV